MNHGDVISTVAAAVHAALLRDLPELPARAYMLGGKERISAARRPDEDDIDVYVFPESWSSTALGYGGMGGSMITSAYTVIVASRRSDTACVYWGPGGCLGRQLTYRQALTAAAERDTTPPRQPGGTGQ